MHDVQNDLIAEFEAFKQKSEHPCLICNSEHLNLVNELLRRGAGGTSLSTFLMKRLKVSIGETSIRRHRRNHLNVTKDA